MLESTHTDGETIASLLDHAEKILRSNFTESFEAAGKALALAQEAGDNFSIMRSLHLIGVYHHYHSDFPTAMEHFQRALVLAGAIGNDTYRLRILHEIAVVHFLTGRSEEAVKILQENLALYAKSQNMRDWARTHNYLGAIYQRWCSFPEALEHYLKAIELWEAEDRKHELGYAYYNLAGLYQDLGDRDENMKALQRSLAFRKESGDRFGEAVTKRSMGVHYILHGQNEKGRKLLLEALATFDELNISSRKIEALTSLGNSYIEEDSNLAVEYLLGALSIIEAVQEVSYLPAVCGAIAEAYLQNRQPEKALDFTTRGLDQALSLNNQTYLYKFYYLKAVIYEGKGDIAESLRYFKLYSETKERLIGTKKQQLVSHIHARYMLERSEKEKGMLRLKSSQLEQEIESKSRELFELSASLVHKQEMLQRIRKEMGQVRHSGKRKHLGRILSELELMIRDERHALTSERQFHEIHQGFIQRLAESCPELTPAELKVCSLLRINCSSKDMAQILCISAHTINGHRRSIRRKLHLDESTNLTTFLSAMQNPLSP